MNKILFLIGLIISTNIWAVDICYIKKGYSVFNNSYDLKGDIIGERNLKTRSISSWEECYQLTITLASKDKERKSIIVIKENWLKNAIVTVDEVKNEKLNFFDANDLFPQATAFYSWRFGDDSSNQLKGKVTAYTSKYENEPIIGDVRYFLNGKHFKY